ncbi:MAG TPA: regulatory protein RecX [Coriobacteriia bacterium]|jgi:regulatory protein
MPEITDIRPTSRGSRRRRLYLDGCEWRSVPQEVVRAAGLRVGQAVEEAALVAQLAEAEPPQAWERALRLLNYRDRGSGELRARLLDDGYEAAVVEDVVERALAMGFLDDRRFAEGLARQEGMKRRGRRRVAAELAAKGVDEALAAQILAECCSPEEERGRALSLARRLASRYRDEVPRLASRLCRAGYEPSLAWNVAREAVNEADRRSDEG